jgi:hypothetical protein
MAKNKCVGWTAKNQWRSHNGAGFRPLGSRCKYIRGNTALHGIEEPRENHFLGFRLGLGVDCRADFDRGHDRPSLHSGNVDWGDRIARRRIRQLDRSTIFSQL